MASSASPILLLSMPQMNDPNFARTVVLLCDYTDKGAFGLVVNPDEVDLTFDPTWQPSVADRGWGEPADRGWGDPSS